MNKDTFLSLEDDELRSEYDLAQLLKNGERGNTLSGTEQEPIWSSWPQMSPPLFPVRMR